MPTINQVSTKSKEVKKDIDENKIYRFNLKDPIVENKRFTLLLWGKSGVGKTELAATAPGKILFINFDPDGYDTLKQHTGKIKILDLATEQDKLVADFKDETTPLVRSILKFLEDNPDYKTVVLDSLTSFGDKALSYGVKHAAQSKQGKNSTIEQPGLAGHGRKNVYVSMVVKTLLQITGRLNRNMILLAHEAAPTLNDDGVVMSITLLLGSNLAENVPIQLSEVWGMVDTGKVRKIYVRPVGVRKPMKSRMFKTIKKQSFILNYNAETQEGEGIEDWHNKWLKAGGKIDLPN